MASVLSKATYGIIAGQSQPTYIDDDADNSTVYMAWNNVDDNGDEDILKIVTTTNGNRQLVTYYKAYDAWANRESASYTLLTLGK